MHLATSGSLLGSLLSPDHLVTSWGLIGLMAIIFAECGLLVGFFLPGDTLLFAAGVLVKKGTFDHPLWLVIFLTFLAAVAGNQVGYEIGRRAGPSVFRRPNSRLFQPEYVERTRAFFEKYGSLSVVLARFVPIVRTFMTVMAGDRPDELPDLHDLHDHRRRPVDHRRHPARATPAGTSRSSRTTSSSCC